MKRNHKILQAILSVICMVSMLFLSTQNLYTMERTTMVLTNSSYEYIILNTYSAYMNVGDEFYLKAVTSTGKKPSFSSSDSKIAAVNTYGKITAKKPGHVRITVKIKNAEATCHVYVKKTEITLDQTRLVMQCGYSKQIEAKVETGHIAAFRSSRTSVAKVDQYGVVTALKPGEAVISVSADGTTVTCKVTVKKPTIRLNRSKISLYRKNTYTLLADSTSKTPLVWKTNRRSVATVDEKGVVTAIKNGTALITVSADGVSKICEVVVKKPTITFEQKEVSIEVGGQMKLGTKVSSGNYPQYSCSNTNVATVSASGVVKGISKGKAYIYASEDGTKAKIPVIVTNP